MAKHYRRKRVNEKLFTWIFIGLLALLVVSIIAAVVLTFEPAGEAYTFTADGHVHNASGEHVGDLETMLANGELTISEDGHIHDAAGNHVGDLTSLLTTTETAEDATTQETPADPEVPVKTDAATDEETPADTETTSDPEASADTETPAE